MENQVYSLRNCFVKSIFFILVITSGYINAQTVPQFSVILTEPSCQGDSDGAIDLSTGSVIFPISVLWSTGDTTEDISGLGAGSYSVTVSDGSVWTSTFYLPEPDSITVNIEFTDISLPGLNDGVMEAVVSGGTPPYSYLWNNGETVSSIDNLGAGYYFLSITDSAGCNAYGGGNIAQPLPQNNDSWLWATATGTSSPEYAHSLYVDNQNNVYMLGNFENSSIQFGSFTLNNQGFDDIFLVKYSGTSVVWAKRFGGTHSDLGEIITGDANGNLYITGSFRSTSFVMGTDTLSNPNTDYCNIYFARLNTNGEVIWARQSGGNGYDYPEGLCTGPGNAVYLCGRFNGASFQIGGYIFINFGSQSYDQFVSKYDQNGNLLWADHFGSLSDDYPGGISADEYGNLYMTGSFRGQYISFGSYTLQNNGSEYGYDAFAVKLNAGNGNPLWAYNYGGSSNEFGRDIQTATNGFVYLTGEFNSSSINIGGYSLLNKGDQDVFAACLTCTGFVNWAKGSGCSRYDDAIAAAIDQDNNFYVAGAFQEENFYFGNYYLQNNGEYDFFILKYNGMGNEIWATSAGGVLNDYAVDIRVNQYHNIFICGYFRSESITFGNYTIINSGSYDVFAAKYGILPYNSIDLPSCYMDSDGGLSLTVTGGVAPFSFLWSDGNTTIELTNIPAGNYSVTVSDFFGFSAIDSFLVTQPELLSVSYTITSVISSDTNIIYLLVTGGTPPYSYLWNDGSTSPDLSCQASSLYSVTVTDANNCNCSVEIAASLVENQSLYLYSGWSMFSLYLIPDNDSLLQVFQPVTNALVIIKDGDGNVCWYPYYDGIIHLTTGKGYQIKMSQFASLQVTGTGIIPEITPVTLNTGWGIYAYLRKIPADIQEMLEPVQTNIIIVKNGAGQVYWPQYYLNQIINMNPGEGYQIKTNSGSLLYY
jgi:hypothetical protein